MRSSRLYALAIVLPVALAVVLTRSMAQVAAPPPAARVAVCDLVELFNNYQRAKDLTARLNERREAIKAESDKRRKAIEALQLELENYRKGSEQYERTFGEIQRLSIEAKAYLDYQDALALREHMVFTKDMYKEIQDMIAQVAKRSGLTVVLQREIEELETNNSAEMLRMIYSRKVLYTAENLDITEQVLSALNQSYKTKAPPAAP